MPDPSTNQDPLRERVLQTLSEETSAVLTPAEVDDLVERVRYQRAGAEQLRTLGVCEQEPRFGPTLDLES